MSTSPQTDNHSWSCRISMLEGATDQKTSYCKFLWGNPCKAIETFYHWDFFLWDSGFSMIFAHSAAWKNSEMDLTVSFFTLMGHRGGNCNCLLLQTARWIPIANKSPRILCTRCFVPWFLTTAFFSKFPFLAPKFSFRMSCSILLLTIVFNLCSSSSIFSDESPGHTIPNRSWVSQTLVFLICTILPRCHQAGFSSWTIIFRPTLNRIPEYRHFEEQ